MTDHEKVTRYAERYFQRHNKTQFPTVRRVAKSLRMKQSHVMDACFGDPNEILMLTGYSFCDVGDPGYPGDLYVETVKDF